MTALRFSHAITMKGISRPASPQTHTARIRSPAESHSILYTQVILREIKLALQACGEVVIFRGGEGSRGGCGGLYWRFISKRGPGRPPIPVEVQALIRRFANENGSRARKVQAELEKLGFRINLATVSRYLPRRNPDHDQRPRWKTFLRNHKDGIAAMDFIVVPTVRFRLLYAWFVIGHGRRDIIHFGVTAHPTSPWVVQQLREAFPNEFAPRFLIYDNDSIFSERVTESIKNIEIEPQRTSFRSPWQNGIAERCWIT